MNIRHHRLSAIAYDGMNLLEMGILMSIFSVKFSKWLPWWYELSICGEHAGTIITVGGFSVGGFTDVETLANADTILIPGWRSWVEAPPEDLLDTLRRAHRRGVRIAAIGEGAAVIAFAGILDGRPVAVAPSRTAYVRSHFPTIMADAGALYIDDGDILTAAGGVSGVDMCLHIVRRDHGSDAARILAEGILAPPLREGRLKAVAQPSFRLRSDERLEAAMDWASTNLREPITVRRIAEHAGMTERTLTRHFKSKTGLTPLDWLVRKRVERARELLKSRDLSVDDVAFAAGFSSTEAMRYHFVRLLKRPPTLFRALWRKDSALSKPFNRRE